MVFVFLATGFEDIEALAPIDILRRGGVAVTTVSITDDRVVESAHGVGVVADALLTDVNLAEAELLVLPGGLPGRPSSPESSHPPCRHRSPPG
ncbi:MAG: DJ-1/PfpI family protein [Bacteroidaceae bacterium]|nr:DJ-1/PfpI family protein [Bacteroidaceae bacterium]